MELHYEDQHVAINGSHPLSHVSLPVEVRVVSTTNKLARNDPAGYWFVNHYVQQASLEAIKQGITRSPTPLVGPDGRTTLIQSHETSARFFGSPDDSGMVPNNMPQFRYSPRWREHVPSARALWILQNPEAKAVPFDDDAEVNDFDRMFFGHVLDAVGIRSRSAVMAAALKTSMNGSRTLRWLSLASGAAVPVLRAAADFATRGVATQVDLFDFDAQALALASQLSKDLTPVPTLRTDVIDLFNLDDLAIIASEREQYDMVDILGFFEYLPSTSTPLSSGRSIPSASDFLRQAMAFARPGGMLVFANMLDTHPQLDFVLRVVQWPFIRPRSIAQLVEMIGDAGIDYDRVRILLPDDGVYAVVVVHT